MRRLVHPKDVPPLSLTRSLVHFLPTVDELLADPSPESRIRKSLGWKTPAELFPPEGAFDFVQHWSARIVPVTLGA
jgi:hypothetical protein